MTGTAPHGEAMRDSTGPKFPVGTAVHVRPGRTDCDYPDTPFDGWVGQVVEVQEDACTLCLVRWNPETFAAVSPFFKDRWDFTEIWLDEDDLEREGGTLTSDEQLTGMLFPDDDRDGRIRSVFGLFDGDPLPLASLDAFLTATGCENTDGL